MEKDSVSYFSTLRDSIVARDSLAGSLVQDSVVIENDSLQSKVYTEIEKPQGHEGTALPFNMEQADGVFGLLLLCFLFFTHIYNGGIDFLKENVSILFASDQNQRIHKQTTVREYLYSYFLIFQTIVLVSICIQDIFLQYDSQSAASGSSFVSILSYILFIALFLGIKDAFYALIGYIFDEQKKIARWRKRSIVGIEILGILYFLPILLLVYANVYHLQIIIFILFLFLIVQLILFYQIIVFFIREKFNFLYLIAYLCTFEILPYIFLVIGLVYLYRIDVFNTLWH